MLPLYISILLSLPQGHSVAAYFLFLFFRHFNPSLYCHSIACFRSGPGSSVGIVTNYELEGPGIESDNKSWETNSVSYSGNTHNTPNVTGPPTLESHENSKGEGPTHPVPPPHRSYGGQKRKPTNTLRRNPGQ